MSQINDIALVAQVVVFKNTRAFDTLVKKYQSPIRRFFLHQTLGDTELSDDLAQETFIKKHTPTWLHLKICPVFPHGFTVLLIIYFMTIFAAKKKRPDWKLGK